MFALRYAHYTKTSNARHHPPRIQLNRHSVLRMRAARFAVGCMPLLGGCRIMQDAFCNLFYPRHRDSISLFNCQRVLRRL